MAPGNDANTARRARATRSAGLLPLVIGLASAAALTGAAYLTVDNASCGAPAQYIRHDSHVELVGGCVDGSNLPATGTPATGGAGHGNYNP
ncbi:hypothetical protein AB0M80_04405 [Amycolatopsis sp. NPDC051045]|uniref:hypothetical protein n=1 Tax=Amycolatopsis sp. NPDC051045 TaxID=3156922 RepID=UPI003423D8C1